MQKTVIAVGVSLFAMVGAATLADAAPMSEVLKACANSKGCGYSTLGSGDVVGCSPKSKGGNGTCFYCNSKTKDCFQVARTGGGKWRRVPGDALGGLWAGPKRQNWWW
jgi:hypothetical protein